MAQNPRTIVYVDGFNLYYGCIKHTSYKWVDLKLLAETCYAHCQGDVSRVKYFTAQATGAQRERQKVYIRALQAHIPGFAVQYGFHIRQKTVRGRPVNPALGAAPIEITTTEEKGSDVNLAVRMVSDPYRDAFDTAILISNDGDLRAPVLEAKGLGKTVIVLMPWRPGRTPSKPLIQTANANFLVKERHLSVCQMPNPLITPAGRIVKPQEWN